MNVSLTPELERFIAREVSSGRYQTASEVVRDGLKLLAERDQRRKPGFMVSSMEELHTRLEEAVESLDRGEYGTMTADDIIAEGRKRMHAQPKDG